MLKLSIGTLGPIKRILKKISWEIKEPRKNTFGALLRGYSSIYLADPGINRRA